MGDTQVEELFESEQVHLFKDGVYTETCRLMCYKLLIGGMALSKVQDTLRVILHLVGKKVSHRAPAPPRRRRAPSPCPTAVPPRRRAAAAPPPE
jgi:hypothetical protein